MESVVARDFCLPTIHVTIVAYFELHFQELASPWNPHKTIYFLLCTKCPSRNGILIHLSFPPPCFLHRFHHYTGHHLMHNYFLRCSISVPLLYSFKNVIYIGENVVIEYENIWIRLIQQFRYTIQYQIRDPTVNCQTFNVMFLVVYLAKNSHHSCLVACYRMLIPKPGLLLGCHVAV